MCFQNFTQHSGCGHYGETYHNHYTPCETAFQTLLSTRGPSSPPLSPPAEFFHNNNTSSRPTSYASISNGGSGPATHLRRASTAKSKRFFSMSTMLQRANTTAGTSTRRAVSDSTSPSGATPNWSSSGGGAGGWLNDFGIPDHELRHVASTCPELTSRTLVSSSAGQVCKECKMWIELMRSMIEGYDKGRGVRGTPAFKKFLMESEDAARVKLELGLP